MELTLSIKTNKCKFYPSKCLGVIAGNVLANTGTYYNNGNDKSIQIGDRVVVQILPSSGQVPYLMQRWANECRSDKKCTKWIKIADHEVTCRIDSMSTCTKSRSLRDSLLLRSSKIIHIGDPATICVRLHLDQFKVYASKLAILDGIIIKINNSDKNTMAIATLPTAPISTSTSSSSDAGTMLAEGERCWLHVRSNILSLLNILHGDTITDTKGEGKCNKISTGWIQFARSIPLTCRVVIDDNLTKHKYNAKGALHLECYDIIDIPKFRKSTQDYNFSQQPCHKRFDRKERHRIFAEWLLKIYGAEFLSRGSGILDIAGGGGRLSNAFYNLGIKSCLLDPDPRCDVEKVPFEVIDEPLIGNGSDLTQDAEKDENYLSNPTLIKRKERIRNIVSSCSIIVGLHPDEATEAVIDTSLRLGKLFAVMPCCVFRNLNPERLDIRKQERYRGVRDPFRSYNTFCRYLLHDKAPMGMRFSSENLPIEGRNKVIYLQSFNYECQLIRGM